MSMRRCMSVSRLVCVVLCSAHSLPSSLPIIIPILRGRSSSHLLGLIILEVFLGGGGQKVIHDDGEEDDDRQIISARH